MDYETGKRLDEIRDMLIYLINKDKKEVETEEKQEDSEEDEY